MGSERREIERGDRASRANQEPSDPDPSHGWGRFLVPKDAYQIRLRSVRAGDACTPQGGIGGYMAWRRLPGGHAQAGENGQDEDHRRAQRDEVPADCGNTAKRTTPNAVQVAPQLCAEISAIQDWSTMWTSMYVHGPAAWDPKTTDARGDRSSAIVAATVTATCGEQPWTIANRDGQQLQKYWTFTDRCGRWSTPVPVFLKHLARA